MELIKLLCFLTFGIFIRQFSFFVIISLFWMVNFFIGIYLNKEYFEKTNILLTNLVYQIILFGEWIFKKNCIWVIVLLIHQWVLKYYIILKQ